VIYAFDLLAVDDEVLLDRPLSERRERLAGLLDGVLLATPATTTPTRRRSGSWRRRA
jgi:ATP-dependent DNA ligase